MTLAVMTWASLGHTGHPLAAGPDATAIYVLVTLAAVLRVLAPLGSAVYLLMLNLAGAAWSGAFGLFVVLYAPVLTLPRVKSGEALPNPDLDQAAVGSAPSWRDPQIEDGRSRCSRAAIFCASSVRCAGVRSSRRTPFGLLGRTVLAGLVRGSDFGDPYSPDMAAPPEPPLRTWRADHYLHLQQDHADHQQEPKRKANIHDALPIARGCIIDPSSLATP